MLNSEKIKPAALPIVLAEGISQSADWSVCQPVSQSVSQLVGKYVSQLVGWSVSHLAENSFLIP